MDRNEFIKTIGEMAKKDMAKTGILASLTIAQACLESNFGQSSLAKAPNYNLFGIKGSYDGQSVSMKTWEYINGKNVSINANFRKYPSWQQSIEDHSGLFNRLDRYKNLRGNTDYKDVCKKVREDGYATDPAYTDKLINMIETYNLTQYDGVDSPLNDSSDEINVYYRVKTKKHGWLTEIKNLTDYAGWQNSAIVGLAVRVDKGSIKYRVHVKGGNWLGWITDCDINNIKTGWAGNNKPIDAIQVYYYTPANIRPYKKAVYKVNNFGWQHDTDKTNGQDGYAGLFGTNVTKFQLNIK